VNLHGNLAHADFAGNHLVEAPGNHECHYFALPLRQGVEALPELGDGLFLSSLNAIPLES
jgi:hypothetical protein